MEMNEYSYEEIVAMFSDPISILNAGFPVIFAIVISLIILAFYGYRLWTYEIKIIVAVVLGVVGYTLSSTYIPLESMPAGINLPAIIGFACAILGAVIAKFLFKLSIFASGAFLGFSLGSVVFYPLLLGILTDVAFMYEPYMIYVVGGVIALLLGILFVTLFKHVYIIITSLGGMITAGFLVGTLIMPSNAGIFVGVILGIVMGIVAMTKQYKMAREMEE